MLIDILKFIHVLCALSLLGSMVYGLATAGVAKVATKSFSVAVLLMSVVATITGTFLVYPKHFTFHTPWIQAAYLLVIVFMLGVSLLLLLQKKFTRWMRQLAYFILICLLVLVVHDAVTKTTFISIG